MKQHHAAAGGRRHRRDREAAGAAGRRVQVRGSVSLARQLVSNDLVDEYFVMVEPILLGGGKRLFPDDGNARQLELMSATTSRTSVLVCTCRPTGRSRQKSQTP